MYEVVHDPVDELEYLAWQIRAVQDGSCQREWGLDPDRIERPLNSAALDLSSRSGLEELCEYMDRDRTVKPSPALIDEFQTALNDRRERFIDFFSIFAWPIPAPPIRVHLTRYGPGGSYHPRHRHRFVDADITIRIDQIVDEIWMVQVAAHETIHLIIQEPLIDRYRIPHAHKEGVVSHIQQSDEARKAFGALRWPEGYAARPESWQEKWIDFISWNKRPKWTVVQS